MQNRELAKTYFKLLTSVDWSGEVLVKGLREGLNKFLTNAFLAIQKGKNKYHKTHYVSPLALQKLNTGDHKGLIFEHIVPKTKYIQRPCEEKARLGQLSEKFIKTKLDAYWKLATITKDEDQRLNMLSMSDDWDGKEKIHIEKLSFFQKGE